MTQSLLPRDFARLLVAACAGLSLGAAAQLSPAEPGPVPGSGPQPAGPGMGSGPGLPVAGERAGDSARDVEPGRVAQASTPRAGVYERGDDGYSLLPFTRRGYWGISLGRPQFKTGCGIGPFACANPSLGVSVYTGGLLTQVVGIELGYTNTGKAARAGGHTRAQGVNLSVVGRVPLGAFNVFAKAGVLYGETRVSADALSGVPSGKRRGWGSQYAVGAGFDFTPTAGMLLEWSRSEWRFPGMGGRQGVDTIRLGFVQRF